MWAVATGTEILARLQAWPCFEFVARAQHEVGTSQLESDARQGKKCGAEVMHVSILLLEIQRDNGMSFRYFSASRPIQA